MLRKWLRRCLVALFLAMLGAGAWAALNWEKVRTEYAARRFANAATDEARAAWADAMASQGNSGEQRLIQFAIGAEPPLREAASEALERRLVSLPENDPHATQLASQLLELFSACDQSQRESLVLLLPRLVACCDARDRAACRKSVSMGLAMPSIAGRLLAIRAALHPKAGMRAELAPLLNASEPEVRRAALFAIGPATDAETAISDEELFHWLHDADAGVRTICRDSLASRGRTELEIDLGRRLVAPLASERLKLLLDLRHEDEIADPEPWLERLSRDPDPSIRAGAARVAMELSVLRQLPPPAWLKRVAEQDPEFAVRRIARFYLAAPNRSDEDVRLITGP